MRSMDTKRLVVPFLLCCLALSLFLGIVKIGSASILIDSYSETNHDQTDFLIHLHPSDEIYFSAVSQSINLTTSYKISSVKFYLRKTGLPVGNLVARLYEHNGTFGVDSNPSTVVLAESEPVAMAWLSTLFALVEFTFNSSQQYMMQANTPYCLACLNRDATTLTTVNRPDIGLDSSSATHVGNEAEYRNSTWYTYSDEDVVFYLYAYHETNYHYIVHGPYYENGQVASCIANVTLYSKTNDPVQSVLNGSDGTADTVTLDVDQAAWYFSWNASATATRSYYLSSVSTDELWVYVADPTKTYTIYTIAFLDLAGVLNSMPYVKAERYINGMKTVEKQKVDIEKKASFYLETWAAYTIVLEDTTTSYTFGDLTFTSTTSISLTLKAVDFPKATLFTYKYVRVYGERALGTPNGTITIMYQDTLNKTNGVQIWINYKNGTNIVYANILANSTFVYTWTSASNDTDYAVVLGITHETYGYYGWKQYFPRGMSEMPWGMAWFGTLPFNTAYVLPAMLIVFAGACFSVVNAYVGAFMMVIIAVLESYMGWLPVPASVIVVAFMFAIIMGIIYAKRKIQS